MRLAILMLLVLVIYSCKTTSNALKTETISLDFATLSNSKIVKRATKGALVQVEINNINTNQYSVQINNTQTNFFTNQPEIFNRLSPATADVTKQTLEKNLTGSSFAVALVKPELQPEIKSLSEKQAQLNGYLTQFASELEEFKTAVTSLKSAVQLRKILTTISQDCSGNFNSIINDANNEVKAFVTKYKSQLEGAAVGGSQTVLKGQMRIIIEYYLSLAMQKYEALKKLNEKIEDVTPELQDNINQTIAKIKSLLQNPKLKKADQDDLEAKKLIVDKMNTTVRTDTKRVAEIMKSVQESYSFIQLFDNSNETSNLLKQYSVFNEKYFTVTNAEIIEKDELLFNVTIQPKPDAVCPSQTLHLPIHVFAKGGFKLDFSSGVFLNFGKNDFFNQTYRLDNVDNDPNNQKIVKNDNRNRVLPSLGVMLHGYVRTGGALQPALSLGLSLSAGETSRLNYHFGPSLIAGKDQRLVASIGWTLAQATILDGKYSEGQVIPKSAGQATIPTTSYYRWGYFFSLSYNLSK